METREARWRNQGILFVVMLLLLLGAGTKAGNDTFQSFVSNTTLSLGNLLTFLIFAGGILSSEGIGWLINHISLSVLTIFRGNLPGRWYSSEWRKELRKAPVWNWLRDAAKSGNMNSTLANRLRCYHEDTLLSFFWQQAPSPLISWVSRRHSVFWASWTAVFSCAMAATVFALIVALTPLHKALNASAVPVIVLFAGIVCVPFIIHARVARLEADEMLELWLLQKFYGKYPEGECFSSRRLMDLIAMAGPEKRCYSQNPSA